MISLSSNCPTGSHSFSAKSNPTSGEEIGRIARSVRSEKRGSLAESKD